MRFRLRIYDARLWAGLQFEAADFGAYALAPGADSTAPLPAPPLPSAHRGDRAPGRFMPAQAQLAKVRWPPYHLARRSRVSASRGRHQPGLGMRLWRASRPCAIDDAELARRFFGIWPSPRTSEPGLRSALLARKPGAGP